MNPNAPLESVSLRRAMPVAALLFMAAASLPSPAQDGAAPSAKPAAAPSHPLTEEPLATYQGDLLDLAFKAVSAMPLNPHLKNRSRAQAAVATACLELDQPRRALRYVDQIEDWRRGLGYAEVAFWGAVHGETAEVPRHLDLAEQIAGRVTSDDDGQDWQRDRIKVTIAKTHAWLGHPDDAVKFAAGTEVFESGKVEAVKAMLIDADAFDGEWKKLCEVLAAGSFDPVKSALETCAQLFNRFYGDAPRRTQIETKIKEYWTKLPSQIQIEITMELAGFALRHEDRAKALALVQEARALIDGSKWLASDHIPLIARLAELRCKAGDPATARGEVDAALARYDAERDKIVDIYRAGTLRPLAEALATLGDAKAAVAIYRRTVEEGIANPNSRPRADDLSATCCSMARHVVEPDAGLWSRLMQVAGSLRDPW